MIHCHEIVDFLRFGVLGIDDHESPGFEYAIDLLIASISKEKDKYHTL